MAKAGGAPPWAWMWHSIPPVVKLVEELWSRKQQIPRLLSHCSFLKACPLSLTKFEKPNIISTYLKCLVNNIRKSPTYGEGLQVY